jgi:hypothetical protein
VDLFTELLYKMLWPGFQNACVMGVGCCVICCRYLCLLADKLFRRTSGLSKVVFSCKINRTLLSSPLMSEDDEKEPEVGHLGGHL